MPGTPAERVSHQTARRCQVAAAPRELRFEILEIRADECRVRREPVEAVLGITPEEPVEQCEVPFSEIVCALLTVSFGRPPARG
jgi:hypothetical protein